MVVFFLVAGNIINNMVARKTHHRRRNTDRLAAGPGVDARQSRDWIFGRHAVAAALANPARRCRRLLATTESAADLVRRGLHQGTVEPEIVARAALDDMLAGAAHQGIALFADPLPEPDLADACRPAPAERELVAAPAGRNLVVVLDQVTDPQNAGAILRSAAAFGARAVVLTERHAPAATGALAKAASGALEQVPLVRVANLARALEQLTDLDYWLIGLDPAAAAPIAAARDYPNVALVLGAEGKGLRRLTADHCDLLVRIPMADPGATGTAAGPGASSTASSAASSAAGPIASLNVSNAAAIALYVLGGGVD